MRMCSIASGSSGNCVYVGSDVTHILIDTGISGKKTEEGLSGLGLSLRDLDGIFISHEHSDHIKGLGVLSRKYGIPIYCSEGTKKGILQDGQVGTMDEDLFHIVKADEKYTLKDLVIRPMKISHDTYEPTAFRIFHGSRKCAVVTDLGEYNDYIVENLKGMDGLLLEANHDVHMLQAGTYPYYLKQRILGKKGHLSNESSGQLLCKLLHDRLQGILLGHLSNENNLPELAFETVRVEITMSDTPYKGGDFPIQVAKRDEVSEIFYIK